jgi:hypothetical protein
MVDECAVCGSKKGVSDYFICLWDYGQRICKVRPVCKRCQKEDRQNKIDMQRERVKREQDRLKKMKSR